MSEHPDPQLQALFAEEMPLPSEPFIGRVSARMRRARRWRRTLRIAWQLLALAIAARLLTPLAIDTSAALSQAAGACFAPLVSASSTPLGCAVFGLFALGLWRRLLRR